MYWISKKLPGGGVQEIASCADHIARTQVELQTADVTITEVPDLLYTCKGCLESWA